MSAPDPGPSTPQTNVATSKLLRAAMWVAIAALVAAAFVCVIWVLIGSQNGLIGRAFLTILLLAGFAGAAILDARRAPGRPAWFALTSMVVWVVTLLIGAFLIWAPERGSGFFDDGFARFVSFLLIILILQLALLHIRLFTRALAHSSTAFTRAVAYITMGLVALLAVMLVLPLMLREWVDFHDIYWRLVVAVTILAAVGTALVPLVNALFAPRRPRDAAQPQLPQGWPTFGDGITPLPVMADGSPDWNAYYTGYPSPPQPPPVPPQQSAPGSQQQWQPAPPQQWQSGSAQQGAQHPSTPPQWAPQPQPVSSPQWDPQSQPPLPPAAPPQQWAPPPQYAEAQEPPAREPQHAPQQPAAAPASAPEPAAADAGASPLEAAREPSSQRPQQSTGDETEAPPGYRGYPPPPPPPR